MNKISSIACTVIMMLSLTSCAAPKAKYVFLFIGDGMGFGAVSVTETYLAQAEDGLAQGMSPLAFSEFPVLGAASTFSANSQVTDSSAGGTALSTGTKVNNGTMAISPEGDTLKSITYKIHDAGFKIGIAATVCMDHATPGSFYGHNIARYNYYEIGSELGNSGFEFFGGGDFNNPYASEPSCFAKAEAAGYTFAYGRDEFEQKKGTADKIVFFQKREEGRAMNDIPTYLSRHERNNPDDICLAEIVDKGINFLDNEKGFFMMAEGSKIDWAAHSNGLPGLIYETIDMSDAVEVALEFYKKHPKNTLIVVTADHETGGPSCKGPNLSIVKANCMPETSNVDNYMEEKSEGDISETAGIGWVTGGHTGDRVPVFAIGAGSEMFAGSMDNTDIPKRICKAMGVEF